MTPKPAKTAPFLTPILVWEGGPFWTVATRENDVFADTIGRQITALCWLPCPPVPPLRKCEQCGGIVVGRIDSRFCTDRCKAKAHRAKAAEGL